MTEFKGDIELYEIDGYERYYVGSDLNFYSNRGRYVPKEPKTLKTPLQNGYPSVTLYKTGNKGSKAGDVLYCHRLIATQFIDNVDNKNVVNHKDGNKENNSLENLEWVTQQENISHAFKNGLMASKLTKSQVLEIVDRVKNKKEPQNIVAESMGISKHLVYDVIGRGTNIKSKGLGDDVEKILNNGLLKPIVKSLKGLLWKDSEDCGCDTRKEILNKLFPYKTECLNEEEHEYLEYFFKVQRNKVTSIEQKKLLLIYNRVFNTNKKGSSCAPCVRSMVNELDKLYKNYKTE